jgi:hypothetical protein
MPHLGITDLARLAARYACDELAAQCRKRFAQGLASYLFPSYGFLYKHGRSLSPSERNKLLHDIPDLFPELSGDAEWERIIADERPRPALTELLDKAEAEFRRNPDGFPELTEHDFSSPS